MHSPAIPASEASRLESLRQMAILDTPDEEALDRIIRVVSLMFEVPIALISLVDENRQWFKACIGLPVRETPRQISFCGHAILEEGLFLIPDATRDERFADNPLVTGAPHIRFYAGVPLHNQDGHTIGTLCLIDQAPREVPISWQAALLDLGRITEDVLHARQVREAQRELLKENRNNNGDRFLDSSLHIWNRQGLNRLLDKELAHLQTQSGHLCLMLFYMDAESASQENHRPQPTALTRIIYTLRRLLHEDALLGLWSERVLAVVWPEMSGQAAERKVAELARLLNHELTTGSGESTASQLRVCGMGLVGAHQFEKTTKFTAASFLEAVDMCCVYIKQRTGRVESFHFG